MKSRAGGWLVAGTVAALLMAVPQVALAGTKDTQPVLDFATEEPVAGAFAQLDRSADGVTSKIRTRVAAGHAATVWYVIFNDPAECSDGECGEDDLFIAEGVLNEDQIEAARISVVWGNSGGVANPAGRISLDGGLAVGEVPSGPGQVLIGTAADGALVPVGVVTGLEDASAEIHLVVQDHGAAQSDPDLLAQQTSSFEGACNPGCEDVQFAVFK
jgi:hypothetical protein